jgi:hypothetical protein
MGGRQLIADPLGGREGPMSGFELGRVGVVLLALYIALQALVGGSEFVASRAFPDFADAQALAFSIAAWFAAVVLLGLLPAAILVVNRDRLSQRWFGGPSDGTMQMSAGELLQVGLVVMAVGGLWEGIVGLANASMLWVSLQSLLSGGREEMADKLRTTLGSNTTRSAANLVLGTSLLWLAKPLARRWF